MGRRKSNAGFPPLNQVARQWGVEAKKYAYGGGPSVRYMKTQSGERFVLKRIRGRSIVEQDWESPDAMLSRVNEIFRTVDEIGREVDLPETAMPLPFLNEGDKFVLNWDNHGFCLMPRLKGRRPSFYLSDDVICILRALGRLHSACDKKHDLLKGLKVAKEYPCLMERFEKRITKYKHTLILARDYDGNRRVQKMLQRGQGPSEELISLAQNIMEGCESAGFSGALIHGDTHENNYLIRKGKEPKEGKSIACTLLDVESFAYGAGVEDLIIPLAFHCAYKGFERTYIDSLLSVYNEERPLSPSERNYIYACLVLPRHWRRVLRRLLKGSRAWWGLVNQRKYYLALACLPAQRRLALSVLARIS